jgi:hypothetical protein
MLNKDIRILQTDKGNCTSVFDESKQKEKLNTLLDPGFMNPYQKILQLKLRGKYRNSFPSTKPLSLLIFRIYIVFPRSTNRTFL